MLSNSQEQTIEIAKQFASTLKGGEVVCLHGDLGAGKTTFVKGIAEYFGINKDEIISPTFIIANNIECKGALQCAPTSISNIIHIDAYRIEDENNMLESGVLEYFGDKNSIVFIEWSENIKKYIPENNVKHIFFNIKEENRRDIEIK